MAFVFGIIAALFIGLTLGLIGSGGSILTLPILVYIFYVPTELAILYSLFIVGVSSAVGAGKAAYHRNIDYRAAFLFGIPSIISIYLTRNYIMPILPEELFSLGGFSFSKDIYLLFLFSIVMFIAAYKMIKSDSAKEIPISKNSNSFSFVVKLILQGLLVGLLAGLIGAGGGFVIIPVLINLMRLPMQKAVGTSLLIIALNASVGFLGTFQQHPTIDWSLLLYVSAASVVGIFIGLLLGTKIKGSKLKKYFGYFVLLMAIYIVLAAFLIKPH
mgnify:FL=1